MVVWKVLEVSDCETLRIERNTDFSFSNTSVRRMLESMSRLSSPVL